MLAPNDLTTLPKLLSRNAMNYFKYNLFAIGKTGFEPATPWSQTKCSTKLSYFPILKFVAYTIKQSLSRT